MKNPRPTGATEATRSRPLAGAKRRATLGAAFLGALLAACASPPEPRVAAPDPCEVAAVDRAVYRRAEVERINLVEAEVKRLRVDLQQAEEALVLAESGMRGSYSRVDAVSALAEARIELERVAARAPWRATEIEEAARKLAEADVQVGQEHFGASLFFTYRARRITDKVEREARAALATPGASFIKRAHVNLRAGPSTDDAIVGVLSQGMPVFPERQLDSWVLVRASTGRVGWVHHTLLGD